MKETNSVCFFFLLFDFAIEKEEEVRESRVGMHINYDDASKSKFG